MKSPGIVRGLLFHRRAGMSACGAPTLNKHSNPTAQYGSVAGYYLAFPFPVFDPPMPGGMAPVIPGGKLPILGPTGGVPLPSWN